RTDCGVSVVAEPLTFVPAVVQAGAALVDLLPCPLTDVVDEEAGGTGVRIEREPVRVAQTPVVHLEALPRCRRSDARCRARRAARLADEGVVGRDAAVGGDPQDLAVQQA